MTPDEVKSLPCGELPALASEVRRRMLETVSRNGGQSGQNAATKGFPSETE